MQYVLGSQPFGRLDIKCRPGVLIPRPETEAYVVHVAELIRSGRFSGLGDGTRRSDDEGCLRIVDFCTGTGCISLLLYSLLKPHFPRTRVHGFDISDEALSLARENLRYNVRRGLLPASALEQDVAFEKADIFSDSWRPFLKHPRGIDLLVSNPPYISTQGFNRDTGRSVRNYEPKLALVPDLMSENSSVESRRCKPEDVFYSRLFEIVGIIKPSVMLFEVGHLQQARRVAEMATVCRNLDQDGVEIWRDWPDMTPEEYEEQEVRSDVGIKIPIQGSGHGRSVMVYRRT